jgi:hypothetical protein
MMDEQTLSCTRSAACPVHLGHTHRGGCNAAWWVLLWACWDAFVWLWCAAIKVALTGKTDLFCISQSVEHSGSLIGNKSDLIEVCHPDSCFCSLNIRNQSGILIKLLILVKLYVSQYKAMLKHSTGSYSLKLHGMETFLDLFQVNIVHHPGRYIAVL